MTTAFKDFLRTSKSKTAAAAASTEAAVTVSRRVLEFPPHVFNINKLPLSSALPPETKRWIRDATDERAAIESGCRFQEKIGQYRVDWIEKNCILYEGDLAGTHMLIADWQYEFFMQWGWMWFSKSWAEKTGQEALGWVRRFRKFNILVPKKNAKSPTLAAAGLSVQLADGEPGNKCYTVALVHDQALLSHQHAIEFVKQNSTLAARCTVNKTTSEIYDGVTKSRFGIRSGSTAGSRNRLEGLNGSLFLDESHVANREQMGILERAGISRRQFIHVQVSTAGTDITGYGYEECLESRRNIIDATEGRDFNFRLKHLEWAIPPDTSMAQLRDPALIDGYIRMATPTLNRIVMEDEIKQEWAKAVNSDTKLAKFAMYRLDLWNASGGDYIAGSDWNKCKRAFLMRSMRPYPAVIGCDFARRRDMCCICVMFAVPETRMLAIDPFDPNTEYEDREINIPHIQPYFYLPHNTVRKYSESMNLDQFIDLGLLNVVNGSTVRPEILANQINALTERYDVRRVGTDSYYSTDVGSVLASKHGWDVESPDSIYSLISQRITSLSPAVEQLMNCVLETEYAHSGNALMDWQLSNIRIIEDNNGNRRFAKATSNSPQKIDGWAAQVNGIFCMMSDPDLYPGQVYSMKVTS